MSEYLLTTREVEVVHDLFYTTRSNSELAIGLGVSVNTVKTHIRHIYTKLNVGNRVELMFKLRPVLGAPISHDDESVSCGSG